MNVHAAWAPERRRVVLVTEGSNYVAGWTIIALLQAGYRVRAALRSLTEQAKVQAAIARHVQTQDRLSFVAADPLADAGWREAAQGADYVLHIAASPPPAARSKGDVIAAPRQSAIRVLTAARAAGVERVVMTSTLEAARPKRAVDDCLYADESVWTNPRNWTIEPRVRSKILAEREAWIFMAKSAGPMSLTTILPGLVVGPVLGEDHQYPETFVAQLLRGDISWLPRVGFSVVDVRDLAALLVQAMVHPEAAGQRFIATSGFLWLQYAAALLRENFSGRVSPLPTRVTPSFVVRMAALVDPSLRPHLRQLDQRFHYDARKAHELLGWRARSSSIAVIECGKSLIHHDLV